MKLQAAAVVAACLVAGAAAASAAGLVLVLRELRLEDDAIAQAEHRRPGFAYRTVPYVPVGRRQR